MMTREVVQNRKQKIQQALNSWYRVFYKHSNKSSMYFLRLNLWRCSRRLKRVNILLYI